MPGLTIRNLPADVYAALRKRAQRNRRSLTQEAATILEDALRRAEESRNPWTEVDRLREALRAKYGSFPDSVPLIREDRER